MKKASIKTVAQEHGNINRLISKTRTKTQWKLGQSG